MAGRPVDGAAGPVDGAERPGDGAGTANGATTNGAAGAGRRVRQPRARLWTRLGLRARVTVMFGLGALLLSLVMGGVSFFTTRHFLVSERQNASTHQAYVNAELVRNTLVAYPALARTRTNTEQLLNSADSGTTGSSSVLRLHHTWYARNSLVGHDAIPVGMRALVLSGTPATESFVLNGHPAIAVGLPIPAVGADYFEVFDVSDLDNTLRVLALALFAGGLITTVLGAVIGSWAASRSLRPLTGVSRAAVAIAGGQLDTRLLAASADPDLAGLTSSFNLMVDQLQERIEREARFTSDVSHELRSPLTTLAASLEVLEARADELSPTARQALELLGADLRRFQRMVGDLLEISRSDTGSADVFLEEVTAGELVRRSVAANVRALPGGVRPPEVTIDPAVAGAWLNVDKRRFERVMANLLENAALYGGGATEVRAEPGPVRADGRGTIRVSVRDHGAGLAPTERAKVFERFYRGHAAGHRGAGTGTGLGLSLVAEHVRLNGGTVWADEADGGGARFVVELPVEDDAGWS
ncbi:MAG TPA: HAMP domain-containing sensor histidine kinase [Acidimicrobiales bacterium]|nr:HAMP domain-containing sensor histidine kinase [Acidimicrobiales bacterium]